MTMTFRVASAFAAAALLSACHSPTQSSGPEGVALHTSEAAQVASGAVAVQFIRVDNDSRCATDVTCISAGNATVVFTATFADGPPVTTAQQFINTTTEPKSVTINGYTFKLVSLMPAPVSTHVIEQSEYVAYISVSRGK
jgi:hypothetical protein